MPRSTTKTFLRRLCVPCGFIVSPTTPRRMITTQKGDYLYVCERKNEWARGHSFLTAKYSYAYVHKASLSEIVIVLHRTTKTFPRRNISVPLANNVVYWFILRKSSILNFENPLFIIKNETQEYIKIRWVFKISPKSRFGVVVF